MRKIIRTPPAGEDPDEGYMELRLCYEGPLRASNAGRDEKTARKEHKHSIRKVFHSQLKRFWQENTVLRRGGDTGGPTVLVTEEYIEPPLTVEAISEKYSHLGFKFVPLVRSDLDLMCGLDILYLRRAKPGDVVKYTGDIDNRLKTLFDALQIPDANQDYHLLTPKPDEVPFFCLLENDNLITKVSVDTDMLLQDVKNPEGDHENDAKLVISVKIRPYKLNFSNIHFA